LRDQRAQEVPVARRNDDGGQGFRGLNDETAEAKERRRKAEEAAPPKSGAERPNPKLVKNAQILGLKAKSLDQLTWAEVNKAYKKLAIEYHPDRLAGKKEEEIKRGQEVFISVQSAYEYFNELYNNGQLKKE
jgi:DnaJ-domain-containing protein 1